MEEREEIDSITLVDKNGIRRLYFRDDFEYGYDTFPTTTLYDVYMRTKLEAKDPVFLFYPGKRPNILYYGGLI